MTWVLLVFFCVVAPEEDGCAASVPEVWFGSAESCEAFASRHAEILSAVVGNDGGQLYAYRHACMSVPRRVEQ